MSSRLRLLSVCVLASMSVSTPAQDLAKVDPHAKLEFENAPVRVTRLTYPLGVTALTHTHDLPRVVVELTDSRQRADDGTVNERKRWTSRFAEPNTVPHKAVYLTASESIIVELKGAAGAAVPVPATNATVVDPAHHKVAFENGRIRVVRMTYPVGAKIPMHSHLPGVSIVLTATSVHSWAPDNTETDGQTVAGSVAWSEAGTHANEVRGKSPLELVRIELKTR
jgi:quercetin dioxygenase-like cupin family protein